MANGTNRDRTRALLEALITAEEGSLAYALRIAEDLPIKDVAHVVVDGFAGTGNPVHNYEHTRDRFVRQWIPTLQPVERLAALVAIDGLYTNDLVILPYAEDHFTAQLLEASAEVVRTIGKHISYAQDLAGGPDTSFDEDFAALLVALAEGPLTDISNELADHAHQLVELQREAEGLESDE